jgi:predicted nucleic acid-binding protein
MIVLDTNVISELMRSTPHPAVIAWVAGQSRHAIYTTSITKAEILFGIGLLPMGRRQVALATVAEGVFGEEFSGRILPFDGAAAGHYAEIVVSRRRAGLPIEALDAQIAAVARACGAAIATRDTADFEGCGVAVIDPWQAR